MQFSRSPSSLKTAVRPKGMKKLHKQDPPQQVILTDKAFAGKLILRKSRINSVAKLQIPNSVTSIILSDNPISDLFGFPLLPNLTHLDLSNTNIENLSGLPYLPNLKTISIENTPFNSKPTYRLAIILSQSPNLQKINGLLITGSEKQLASQYPPECSKLVRAGWIPKIPPPTQSEIEQINSTIVEKRKSEKNKSGDKSSKMKIPSERKQSELFQTRLDQQNKEIEKLRTQIEILMAKK